MFRPKLDVGTDKGKPLKEKKGKAVEHVEKAGCDAIEPAGPAGPVDMKALHETAAKAEKRVNRARSRLDQIEGDLLLSEEQDEAEDLRAEQKDAQARLEKARAEYDKAKLELDQAKAKQQEEARVEADMKAASEADERAKRDEVMKRAKEKAKAHKEPVEVDDTLVPDRKKAAGLIPPPEEECVPVEALEEGDLGPMPKPRKKFKWTPKKAIAVGFVVCLLLPAVVYGFVIPRVDVTVRTWYYEGFLSSITVDSKVLNDGSVEVTNLDINISVMKEVGSYDVYIAQFTGQTPSIGIMSEKNFEGMSLHDDQNDKYVLQVKITFDAGSQHVSRSYTHHIDGPYMNVFFNDHISELAI
jgi:hypothetical protein